MAIQYSGIALVKTTFTGDTKQNIINGLETILLSASWTTISGHNTTNLLMQTVSTPQSCQMRFRFKDNGGSCVQISVENVTGMVTGTNDTNHGASLLPAAAKVWTVIASGYQFACFVAGMTNAREWAFGCVPWVPSFIASATTIIGFIQGNAGSDSDGSLRYSFRSPAGGSSEYPGNYSTIYAGVKCETSGATNWGCNGLCIPVMQLFAPGGYYTPNPINTWANGDFLAVDPLVAWADTDPYGNVMVRGQIWDAIYITGSVAVDTTATFDSHTWQNMAASNGGASNNTNTARTSGGLWLMTA